MYDPNLDWVKLRGYDEKISRTPDFVQELKEYELQEMLLYTEGVKNDLIGKLDALWRVEGQQHYTTDNFPEWDEMERLEEIVKAEVQRRNRSENHLDSSKMGTKHETGITEIHGRRTPSKRKEKGAEKGLPGFTEIVVNASSFLPELWKVLSSMEKPLVSQSGKFIWEGENISVLMALAQALKTRDKVSDDYSTEQVYRMLCRYFNQKEATRPRITATTETGFTYAYSKSLAAFSDIISDL